MSNVDFSGQLMATMEEKVLGHLSCLLLDFFFFWQMELLLCGSAKEMWDLKSMFPFFNFSTFISSLMNLHGFGVKFSFPGK